MSAIVNKLKSMIDNGLQSLQNGYVDEEDEEMFEDFHRTERDYPMQDNLALQAAVKMPEKSNLKVVRHPNSAQSYEVLVNEPRTFEESLEIVDHLRSKRSVILNLHLLDTEQSQRIVDFVSGATHAIDGHQQKIGEGVFIFTPCNVAITAETEKARAISDAFWNRAN